MKLIATFSNYTIWEIDQKCLYKVAKFVVTENYTHHMKGQPISDLQTEIEKVYEEETLYFPYSLVYIALDNKSQIIGSIRTMQWDQKLVLPTQKIFKINPLNKIPFMRSDSYISHIGRLAVTSNSSVPPKSLFIRLMIYGTRSIYEIPNSVMLAECDIHLLHIMEMIGFTTTHLSKPTIYLGSETIAICATQKGLLPFFDKYEYMYKTNCKSI